MNKYITVHQNGEPIYDIFFANDFNSLPELLAGQGIADKRVCIVTESNVAGYPDKRYGKIRKIRRTGNC